MGLFSNPAKKRAKQQTVDDWMRWSYRTRVQSDEASVAAASADRAGYPPGDIAMRVHMAGWEGAAREAVEYYPESAVRRVFEDPGLEKRAAEELRFSSLGIILAPMTADEFIGHVQDMVDLSRDPERQLQMEIERLQNNYAYINATPAPLLEEMRELAAIQERLTELGAEPDAELNQEIKRQMGVEDTPFNS